MVEDTNLQQCRLRYKVRTWTHSTTEWGYRTK